MPFDGNTFQVDPILAVIDRVGELICDEEHWGQDGSEMRPLDGRNRWCPALAINIGDSDHWAQHSKTFKYFLRVIGPNWDLLSRYNDHPDRTFSEIQELIAKARELRLADIMEMADA